ncbi:hypothetical protein HPP92_019725 [Vanilla planifolia]|uniref:Uncharacterized protein n=1 Tax=Vanilla planifolia TaxID=51239 RepID=A0A835PZX4_VANPL|nr:hypothetical protein HPP92_019725 [Vanilla planifolia]
MDLLSLLPLWNHVTAAEGIMINSIEFGEIGLPRSCMRIEGSMIFGCNQIFGFLLLINYLKFSCKCINNNRCSLRKHQQALLENHSVAMEGFGVIGGVILYKDNRSTQM